MFHFGLTRSAQFLCLASQHPATETLRSLLWERHARDEESQAATSSDRKAEVTFDLCGEASDPSLPQREMRRQSGLGHGLTRDRANDARTWVGKFGRLGKLLPLSRRTRHLDDQGEQGCVWPYAIGCPTVTSRRLRCSGQPGASKPTCAACAVALQPALN